jgi:hypothetical protein
LTSIISLNIKIIVEMVKPSETKLSETPDEEKDDPPSSPSPSSQKYLSQITFEDLEEDDLDNNDPEEDLPDTSHHSPMILSPRTHLCPDLSCQDTFPRTVEEEGEGEDEDENDRCIHEDADSYACYYGQCHCQDTSILDEFMWVDVVADLKTRSTLTAPA